MQYMLPLPMGGMNDTDRRLIWSPIVLAQACAGTALACCRRVRLCRNTLRRTVRWGTGRSSTTPSTGNVVVDLFVGWWAFACSCAVLQVPLYRTYRTCIHAGQTSPGQFGYSLVLCVDEKT